MPALRTIAIAAASAFAASAVFAASHSEGLDPAVEARHAHMKLYGFNLGQLGDMARGNTDYDAEAASMAAANLVELASVDQTAYWTEGTATGETEGSRALPAIWEDYAGYEEKNAALLEAAMAMEAVAGDGLEAVQGQMRGVGGACGACHEDYRLSDD